MKLSAATVAHDAGPPSSGFGERPPPSTSFHAITTRSAQLIAARRRDSRPSGVGTMVAMACETRRCRGRCASRLVCYVVPRRRLARCRRSGGRPLRHVAVGRYYEDGAVPERRSAGRRDQGGLPLRPRRPGERDRSERRDVYRSARPRKRVQLPLCSRTSSVLRDGDWLGSVWRGHTLGQYARRTYLEARRYGGLHRGFDGCLRGFGSCRNCSRALPRI